MTKEFLHHLRDTLLLLGGGTQLANLVARADKATAADVDELRLLNTRLIDATKTRLVNLNKLTIITEYGSDQSSVQGVEDE